MNYDYLANNHNYDRMYRVVLKESYKLILNNVASDGSAARIYLILNTLEESTQHPSPPISSLQPIMLSYETRSLSDTHRIIRDAIDIQYCLTEGKRLDDGQINL